MKKILFLLIFTFLTCEVFSENISSVESKESNRKESVKEVTVFKDESGMKLLVDGKDFMINGMNWDYFPIGTNYSYSLWNQTDELIQAALDAEMSLLKNMGVNVIRVYTGIQPKWIQYIYENYGIYTMLNHSFGRYGLTLDGAWVAITDYANPNTQKLLLSEVTELVESYKDTPGLLLYLLGNENNYGLFWAGAETEDFPDDEEEKQYIGEKRGRPMYKLMNEAAIQMKAISDSHPVAICNGDVLFIDIIAEECKDVDIFGVNTYRGVSFTNLYEEVGEKLDMPVMLTEFGADAFNAIENQEDQQSQAYYLLGNWKEIYENAYGLGKENNSIGGFTFQFSDGWWKFGQTTNLDKHDNNASWANGGYDRDYRAGDNNMNEEWFGICAKGPTNERGLYQLYPRAAYYALKKAHMLNPLSEGISPESIENHFSNIQVMDAVVSARGDKAALVGEQMKKVRIKGLRAELTTFSTGGTRIETPDDPADGVVQYPDQLGFDHMESFFVEVEAKPTESVRANVSVNILGNVATNPIDEIFYENRGRSIGVNTEQGNLQLTSLQRVKIYRADFTWNSKQFDLTSFYRTGHYHWGYEGDFFGLYPEANYGPNIDIYNGEAPFGFEVGGKRKFDGFKVAFGPELWWGANPAVIVKYNKKVGHIDVSAMFHEDLDEQGPAVSSFAIPTPPTRRATLHLKRKYGNLGLEVGGIWAGQPRIGETFQYAEGEEGNYKVYQDEIKSKDTWGGKAKVTYASGRFQWYMQGAAMGLVAGGGADYTKTYTGWKLKDSGSGNQMNFLTGFALMFGDFQIAPNFLWQKPLVGPMPSADDVPEPGRSRNILDDPFAVRQNRETVAGELLITYDPTPGTWMYAWDSDMAEDASLAVSAGLVFRHHPTTQDAAIGIMPDGRTTFAFPGAPPARDLWEVHARIVSKINPNFGIITNLYGGEAEANGSDERLIERFGADLRMIYKKTKLTSHVKVNDWGPYDYHRDFNLTYPLQLMADFSTTVSKPNWFDLPDTRIGLRCTWRSLDQYSPRYCPTKNADSSGNFVCDPTAPGFPNGTEWEIRTYLHFNIGM